MTKETKLATVLDVNANLAGLTQFARTPTSPADDSRKGLSQLAPYRDGAIFTSKFSGTGGWERHSNGDEIVHVIEGNTLLRLLSDEGPQTLELGAGTMVVVPKGVWHRFESATGVTLMSITPLPTDHPPVDVSDPR